MKVIVLRSFIEVTVEESFAWFFFFFEFFFPFFFWVQWRTKEGKEKRKGKWIGNGKKRKAFLPFCMITLEARKTQHDKIMATTRIFLQKTFFWKEKKKLFWNFCFFKRKEEKKWKEKKRKEKKENNERKRRRKENCTK